jgi:hypothetical protein
MRSLQSDSFGEKGVCGVDLRFVFLREAPQPYVRPSRQSVLTRGTSAQFRLRSRLSSHLTAAILFRCGASLRAATDGSVATSVMPLTNFDSYTGELTRSIPSCLGDSEIPNRVSRLPLLLLNTFLIIFVVTLAFVGGTSDLRCRGSYFPRRRNFRSFV